LAGHRNYQTQSTAGASFWQFPPMLLIGTAAAGGIALINLIGSFSGWVAPFAIRYRCAAIRRVSDTWPPSEPLKPESLLEHIRNVWVLHGIERNCVAGLYRTMFGIELRLHLGNELIESRLSRYGEAPLLLIAEQANRIC